MPDPLRLMDSNKGLTAGNIFHRRRWAEQTRNYVRLELCSTRLSFFEGEKHHNLPDFYIYIFLYIKWWLAYLISYIESMKDVFFRYTNVARQHSISLKRKFSPLLTFAIHDNDNNNITWFWGCVFLQFVYTKTTIGSESYYMDYKNHSRDRESL